MSGRMQTVLAHAKINLVLRILSREASGYHAIETLFQRLALHDVVRVTIDAGASALHCHGPSMPNGGLGVVEENLAWRAAVAYTQAAAWPVSWQIDIEKHIPVGGGLGGGSADAAAVLRAMEAMCPTPLGMSRVLAIAGTLGADVPFLVSGHALAWAWGRGDRLLPLPALPARTVELVVFEEGVNTGAAYGAFARAREAGGAPVLAHSYSPQAFESWEAVAAVAGNDFELVVPALHAGVRDVLPLVRALADAAANTGAPAIGLMSGSGATCFVLHPGAALTWPALPVGARVVRTATAVET